MNQCRLLRGSADLPQSADPASEPVADHEGRSPAMQAALWAVALTVLTVVVGPLLALPAGEP